MGVALSGAGDLTHGVVEGQAQDLDAKVNGVAGQAALGPPPIGVFEDQARIGRQGKVARLALDQLKPALLE